MKITSKLLISESPLQVLPTLAVEVGLSEAIVLQQIHYLSMAHDAVEIDGEMWVKRSFEDLTKIFPFWCEKTIKNIMASLKRGGHIITRKYGNSFDRCNYYAVCHESLLYHSGEHKAMKDRVNNTLSIVQDLPDQIVQDLPDQIVQDLPDVISFKSNKKNIRISDETFAKQVINAYHTILPKHPKVRIISSKRVKAIIKCSSVKETFRDIEFWEVYFESIKNSTWHCGENPNGWVPDIDWLTSIDNFVKMYERAC